MRARKPKGSVVFNKRRGTWNFLFVENGQRKSRKLGTLAEPPTRQEAVARVAQVKRDVRLQSERTVVTVKQLTEQYRQERMPTRASTARGYNCWLNNHVLPRWGESPITALQPRVVELWLQPLELSPKSKVHIRGQLSILLDYAQWHGYLPVGRNPMELVTIQRASKRTRKVRSLSGEQFQALLAQFKGNLCWRTLLLLAVSFGLRVSEVLGLKWSDIDWLQKTITIERGVVKQIVDSVKSEYSAASMAIADELLDVVRLWRQETQFSAEDDWMFASPVKLGRLPLSYTHVWEALDKASERAGVGHVSSHVFRHTYRTWLDSTGSPIGVQKQLMRHSDIRTTMNIYGDAITADMRQAQAKVAALALPKSVN